MNMDMFKNMISDTTRFDKEKKYWINQFSGELKKTYLPYDFTGNDATSFNSSTIKFKTSDELFLKLNHLTNRSDNNLFVVLAAGLMILLNRYTGNDDIVIGMPILKQEKEGDFLNMILALRKQVYPGMTLKKFLMQVKQTINEANEHSNYPIERLEYYLGSENPGSGYSLFETVIMLRNIHENKYLEKMNHNMVFRFNRSRQFLEGILEYNRHLYRKETAEDLVSHLLKVLQNMIINLDLSLSHINILLEKERKQLLVDFNGAHVLSGKDKLLHELFQDQVKKNPGNQAVISIDHGLGARVSLTYKQLNEKSNQLARFLRQKGVGTGTIVGIMISPSLEMAIAIMSISKAGGAYLPIDYESPPDRIKYLLRESHCKILLTQRFLSEKINFAGKKIDIDEDKLFTGKKSDMEPLGSPDDLFYTIYTSGTSGRPKGGLLTHRNLVNYVTWFSRSAQLTGKDKTILTSSYAFDLGYTIFLGSLSTGGELHLIPKEMYINTARLLDYIKGERISYLKMTPSLFSVMLNTPGFSVEACSTLRLVVLGGEEINVRDLEKAHQICSHIEFMNHYGPTETTIGSVAQFIDFNSFEEYKTNPTIGKPIDNTRIYILDKYLGLLPIGVPGELAISGSGVARGYLNHPELTAEKFLPVSSRYYRSYMPYITYISKKLYMTGDMARWHPDGNIRFLGRKDNQVKIRGFRIELGEIQNRMLKNQQVQDGVIITKDEQGTGKYVCAYVVPQSPANPFDVQTLRDFLSVNLPEFMIPSHFIILDEIPLTPNGKVDRQALPSPLSREVGNYAPPQNEVEKNLADLWANSLKIEKDLISVNANFFDLGGHSLSAAVLVTKIHQTFDVQMPLMEIFEKPTIRDQAGYLKEAGKKLFASIPAAEMKDYYPLSSSQSRLHFLQQMELTSTAYNIVQAFTLQGESDRDRLAETFRELIHRHESLRTSFEVTGNQTVQRVHKTVEFEIDYSQDNEINANKLPAETRGLPVSTIKNIIRPFDLSRCPLFRVGLVKIQSHQHVMIVDLHHIISDGISHRILMSDFIALYNHSHLSGLRLQYKDYSEWQQSEKVRKMLHHQEKYWVKEFQEEIPVLNLPIDFPRPAVQVFEGTVAVFEISREETGTINEIAASQGATMFMVLQALFNIFLAKLSNQDDVVVGTPIAGRRHAHLERIIGVFINTLALRNYIPGGETFIEFLKKVKDRTIAAFENQDYKFEDLVEKAEVKRDMSRNPLFDVMFIFQNIQEETANSAEGLIKGLKIAPHPHETGTSKLDLTLYALERNQTLHFRFEYCTRLFKEESINRFIQYFKKVIASVIENPLKKIAEIEIILDQEKKRILCDFNNTGTGFPQNKTTHELFEEQAARTPEGISVLGASVFHPVKDNPEPGVDKYQLTYRELNERSNQLARKLRTKGVKPGSIVSIMLKRSLEMIIGIWGVMKAGGAYLPLDPAYPGERTAFILQDSNTATILTSSVFNTFPAEHFQILEIDTSILHQKNCSSLNKVGKSTDLAYVIYTSGSTGKPKGVMIEHRSLVNFIKGITRIIDFSKSDNILSLTTISFDIFGLETILPLTKGTKVVIGTELEQANPETAALVMQGENINLLQVTPSRLLMLITNPESAHGLNSLKCLLVGGEALPNQLLEKAREVVKGKIYNLYGPTETTIWSTIKDVGKGETLNIGKPISNTGIYILDRNRNLQPMRIAGELWISGTGLARGYINNSQLTGKKFITNPYEKRERLYDTGDIAMWLPDGNIEFYGRKDFQVKIRGFRIELGEIETQLKKYPGIKETVVACRDDENENKYICAYFVNEDNSEETPDTVTLRTHLSHTLPAYMIPSYFVRLESIPLTPNGKIDRKALPAPHLKPDQEYIAPRDETEKKLVEVWSQVLGIDKDVIGIDSNFFQLGGHSLNATVMAVKIHKEFNIRISLAEMFKAPTIRAVSSIINIIGWASEQKSGTRQKEELIL